MKNNLKIFNLKGAASIFIVMSILAAILTIALGSSFIVSIETRLFLGAGESVVAYYAAEGGIEGALYDKAKLEREPRGNRCPGNCPGGFPGLVCSGTWTCTENVFSSTGPYCLEVTHNPPADSCDPSKIIYIKSIGEYKSTRRSIEISF